VTSIVPLLVGTAVDNVSDMVVADNDKDPFAM